jgi:hypothetical protein
MPKAYRYIDEYTELLGKTDSFEGVPDAGVVDIGFHYTNWYFSNAGGGEPLLADLNQDRIVNFKDFAVLAGGWLTTYDINDLDTMAGEWLDKLLFGVTLNQEPNLVSDVLEVTVAGTSDDITCYLLMDGQYLGRFCGGDISIPTYEYCNGHHEIKVVGANIGSEIFAAPTISITVNNRLHCLTGSETYEYNKAYRFAGFYEPDGGSTISFEIKDLNDNVIWTNSSSGNFNFEVPAGVLQSPYNELIIQEVGGGRGEDWTKDITKRFDITTDPNAANARSLLVSPKEKFTEGRKEVWVEFLNTCKRRGRSPTICLFGGQATRKNIQTALSQSGVMLVLIISHGDREVDGVHRTHFDASDGEYFSYLKRNWYGPPGEYEPLSKKNENGYSVCDLRGSFHWRERMYVFIDACRNGTSVMDPMLYDACPGTKPQNNDYSFEEYERTADMAKAFDIWDVGENENRIYMSWRPIVFARDVSTWYPYSDFLKELWTELGRGKSFSTAISEAACYSEGTCQVYVKFSWVGNTSIIIY